MEYNYMDKIRLLGLRNLAEAAQLREAIHREPETCYEEYKTAEKICAVLDKHGIPYQKGIGKTGVTGMIRGGRPGKTVLLHADMDALDMEEAYESPYKSTIPGKMHGCGHDGNTACLMGALLILNDMKDELPGNVKFVFQPAEEGGLGSVPVVESGILENPHVDAAFSLHVNVFYPTGKMIVRYDQCMATSCKFDITFHGKRGTGTVPGSTVDPASVMGQFISSLPMALQKIDAWQTVVTAYTKIALDPKALTATLSGAIRCYNDHVREEARGIVESLLTSISELAGTTYDIEYGTFYPAMTNDYDLGILYETVAKELFGPECVVHYPHPFNGGDDFSNFCKNIPGFLIYAGVADQPNMQHHDPMFHFASEDIIYGLTTMAGCAAKYLFEAAEER